MSVTTNAGFLDSVPIGCMMMWPTDTAPINWLICNGQAVSRTAYPLLFKLIGTTHGAGNGSTTFNLPNFTDRSPIGKGSATALGAKVGSNKTSVTLSVANLPAHKAKTIIGYSSELRAMNDPRIFESQPAKDGYSAMKSEYIRYGNKQPLFANSSDVNPDVQPGTNNWTKYNTYNDVVNNLKKSMTTVTRESEQIGSGTAFNVAVNPLGTITNFIIKAK